MKFVTNLKNKVVKFQKRRAAIAELNSLNDRELNDIGISRYDIPRVVRQSGL